MHDTDILHKWYHAAGTLKLHQRFCLISACHRVWPQAISSYERTNDGNQQPRSWWCRWWFLLLFIRFTQSVCLETIRPYQLFRALYTVFSNLTHCGRVFHSILLVCSGTVDIPTRQSHTHTWNGWCYISFDQINEKFQLILTMFEICQIISHYIIVFIVVSDGMCKLRANSCDERWIFNFVWWNDGTG